MLETNMNLQRERKIWFVIAKLNQGKTEDNKLNSVSGDKLQEFKKMKTKNKTKQKPRFTVNRIAFWSLSVKKDKRNHNLQLG